MMSLPWDSSHAIAICAGVQPLLRAMALTAEMSDAFPAMLSSLWRGTDRRQSPGGSTLSLRALASTLGVYRTNNWLHFSAPLKPAKAAFQFHSFARHLRHPAGT
jgi:poly-beta-hydroxyalkanoate depolymerase